MNEISAFTKNVVALSLALAATEFLLPNGRMRQSARVGTGMLFFAYVAEWILGIIASWGV